MAVIDVARPPSTFAIRFARAARQSWCHEDAAHWPWAAAQPICLSAGCGGVPRRGRDRPMRPRRQGRADSARPARPARADRSGRGLARPSRAGKAADSW